MSADDQDLLDNHIQQERGQDDSEQESPFILSDNRIVDIVEALHSGYDDAVVHIIDDLSVREAADLLEKISEEERELLLTRHAAAFKPETYSELDPELQNQMLSKMPPKYVAAIISELDSDDALNLIENLDEDARRDVIHNLSASLRIALVEGLNYPEYSAGRLMQREYVAIPQFWTVGKTIDYLRAAGDDLPDYFYDLFVVTPTYKVVGEIPLSRVIRARRAEKIDTLKLEDIHPVPATMNQEEVAQMFMREDITSAPVVDEEERLIGMITIDDVVDVIDEEAQEDMLKMSGVEQSDLYRAVISTASSRFRWLFINLFTALMAATVISFFSDTIEKLVALAVLMPIVAGMGGNAGTQALAVAVRSLATNELSRVNERRVVLKEVGVGAINGLLFATIIGTTAGLWFQNPMLGCVIGAAMIINLITAGFFGAFIPIILDRIGADPAVASSVFLTTMTDIVGFFAFLGLATIFLI
ncbi:MAG: magnesium transporter [Alphaproteobacteria bacterium]|nr:magnesium transporter [Alphaproteobacteria bacterium]